MGIHSLADRRERNREAAEAVYAVAERETKAARDAIMARTLRRLAVADPQSTLDVAVDRLGHIWTDAWPFREPRP